MKQVSEKQRKRNKILSEYKKLQPKQCVICGGEGTQLMHILPRSLYPEYYTEPDNLCIGCQTCHSYFDDNIDFRKLQTKLYNQAFKLDPVAANRYFKMN